MGSIQLRYGRGVIPVEYSEERFDILGDAPNEPALSDAQVGSRIHAPIDSGILEDVVEPGRSVLIVVPDATRQTACAQVVNLIVRRLIANGTSPGDIRIIFATGIHRQVTEAEKLDLLTPFIAQRIKTLDHDPRDLASLFRIGETSGGIPVEISRSVLDHDRIILVGGVSFHYFAGFTGGRKLICPGLASARTITETHKLAFDCKLKTRRDGVETGVLDGNAVHEAFIDAVSQIGPSFAVNSIVNDRGEVTDLYCGHWKTAHRAACEAYAAARTTELRETRPVVVVSCGGFPYDINMIQAHKALDAAAKACSPGGRIYFLAECADGLGRDDFLKWFSAEDSQRLAEQLCDRYQVNGQTAWALLQKSERFDVRVVTSLDAAAAQRMRLTRITPEQMSLAHTSERGYIIPYGAKFRFVI